MGIGAETVGKDIIGNVRFEFFTGSGSITIEAWKSTAVCRVTTFSSGLRRRTEVRLDERSWDNLVVPISGSGFWKWSKRYDSHSYSGYPISWSFSLVSESGWYYSSGDGEYPEGFAGMLRGMIRFAGEVEGLSSEPVGKFLSPYIGAEAV